MGRIWAVARYTLAQCLRTKIAAVFVILLAAGLVVLPFTPGDGTLAGRIRTFLAYGTSATAILLSLVTIFLSVALVAGDVQAKQIFLLATKPVGRWQYIVGRWLGIVLLDAILLAIASTIIYGVAQHLRAGEAPGLKDPEARRMDRMAVENEIFTARAKVSPEPVADFERLVAEEKKRIGQAKLEETVKAYVKNLSMSDEGARIKVEEDIRKQVTDARQSIGPFDTREWEV